MLRPTLGGWLLQTKLYIPPSRPNLVSRQRLIERLNQGLLFGNKLALISASAGFLEAFLWRGYLMNRLIDVQGKQTMLAWIIAVLTSAFIFGLAHAYQGPVGVLRTGLIGVVFGFAYLAVGRNLWPLIIAHAWIDTIDFVTHYFGG